MLNFDDKEKYDDYERDIYVEKKNNLIPAFLEFLNNKLNHFGHLAIERACKEDNIDIVKGLYKKIGFCALCLMYAMDLDNPGIRDLLTKYANPTILSLAFHHKLKENMDWARSVIDKVIPEKVITEVINIKSYFMLDILFERGLLVNKTRALQNAAISNDMKMVEYLVDKGASNFNETLVSLCKNDGNIDMVKYFIILGANDFEGAMKFVNDDDHDLITLLNDNLNK